MKTATHKPRQSELAHWMREAKKHGAVQLIVFYDSADKRCFARYVRPESTLANEINRHLRINPLAEHVETLEVPW